MKKREASGPRWRDGSRALVLVGVAALARCASPRPVTPTLSGLGTLEQLKDSGKTLPRPRLPANADTNAAKVYYQWGTQLIRANVNLDTAEMALYWASQLDPTWAEPLYLQSFIPLRALRSDALETWRRTRSTRAVKQLALTPRQAHVVDSLQRIAWQRNPFVYTELEFSTLPAVRQRDEIPHGWFSFATGRFRAADSLFGIWLRKHPEDVGVRIYRARALFYLGSYDSAVVELEVARDSVRRRAEAHMSLLLPTVEMFELAIGIARVQQDDFPAARAAFERALTQNLGLYWAHARLAGSALALHDTVTALSELDMAVQLEGRDPALRLYDGVALEGAGRLEEADGQLRQAIALDPYYAAPYYWLAVTCRRRGMNAAAREQYGRFFSYAARDDPYRTQAARELAALEGAADSR